MKPESALQPVPRSIYRRLTDQLSGAVAREFFDQAVRALAFSLDAEYAFITRRAPADSGRLQIVAAWHVNRPAATGIQFTLAGTPAADTLRKHQLWYEDGVAARYPHDRWLLKHGVRAYCAVAIAGVDGAAIGHVGIMCRQPLQADDELFSALHMLARRAAAELQRLSQEPEPAYREFFENATEGIYWAAPDGRLLHANPALARLLGYADVAELLATGINIDSALYLDCEQRPELRHKHDENGGYSDRECRAFCRDGSTVWVRAHARAIKDAAGHITNFAGMLRDDSARRHAEDALLRSEEKYRMLVDLSQDGVFLSQGGLYVYTNRAFARMLAVHDNELAGTQVSSTLLTADSELGRQISTDTAQREGTRAHEIQLFRKGGHETSTVSVTASSVSWRGRPATMGTVRDITERKQIEQALMRNAYHDVLTGLPNRTFFLKRLDDMLQSPDADAEQKFAVLFLDIDRFKLINDSLGHSFGDCVLVAISKRLRTCVRPQDVIARYGGDEFAILLERIQGLEEATAVADRIHEELARAFTIDGRDVFSTASIGILMQRVQHYRQPDELLRDADTAMYRAKAAGKAGYVVFDEAMHAQAEANLQLETELRHALQRNEFRVYFQPIIELSTGRLTGLEALVRWAHPARGLIAPEHFLPVAEDTGLIMPLGWWVMETACTYMEQWRKRYKFLLERVTVSVNIANRQFAHWVLPQRVQRMLETVGLPPANLCLEITETVFMANPDLAVETINRLRAIGVSLQMDDFGTGYSSLSALRTFRLNTLKIDRSFISGIMRNRSDRAIVRTVTVLAADLGMDVVAEGIENVQQLELLRALGCRRGQGYYFSTPLAASEVHRYLDALTPARPEACKLAIKS